MTEIRRAQESATQIPSGEVDAATTRLKAKIADTVLEESTYRWVDIGNIPEGPMQEMCTEIERRLNTLSTEQPK